MTLNPRYHAILHALAAKFYNYLPEHEKPRQEDYVSALQEDMRGLITPAIHDPPWKQWLKTQQGRNQISSKEYRHDSNKRMTANEWLFLADSTWHTHTGNHTLVLPWETIESISAFKIDRNVKTGDLVAAKLPEALWIEWPKMTAIASPPWITRTIGTLISRLLLLDAPIEYLHALAAPRLRNEDDTVELIRSLTQTVANGLPSVGYRLIIVQQDTIGYRFITSLFGHEYQETIVDMLSLHKEVSDRDNRKFRQTEQVWTNIAVRILLLTAHKQWFLTKETNVCADASLLSGPEAKNNIFFCQKGARGKQICIRPEYRSAHPFRVESE